MRPPNRAQGPAIFLLLSTTVMFLTLVGHGWQIIGIEQGGFGPLGIETCAEMFSSDCTSYWWSDLSLSGPIPVLGVVTLVTGVCAFAFALSCSILAFARRLDAMPTRTARVLLVPAIGAATTWQILLATRHEVAALTYFEITSVGYAGVLCVAMMCLAWFCVHRLAAHARRPAEHAPQPIVVADPIASAPTQWGGLPPYAPTPSQPGFDGVSGHVVQPGHVAPPHIQQP